MNYLWKKNNNQKGFTIIELVIATAVFSVVLLIATVAVIMVTNSYVKGDVQAETQDTARSILTIVSQDIQFNTASSVNLGTYNSTSNVGYFCLGNDLYVYQLGDEIGGVKSDGTKVYHALLEFSGTGTCPPSSADVSYLGPPVSGDNIAHELLAQNMILETFNVAQVTGTKAYSIKLTVAYGSNVISTGGVFTCPPESFGGQFCAVSSLTTAVTPRIQ
jgi:prepilin-type N-terminal cleavage/methylation domain-containing protein